MNDSSRRLAAAWLVALAVTLIPSVAVAQESGPEGTAESSAIADSPVHSDRWNLSLGAFLVELRTDAQVGFSGIVGSILRLEDTLGLDSNHTTGRLDGLYRIKPRHAIEFGVLEIDRSASGELDTSIDFEDTRFVGWYDSKFEMAVVRVIYRYSFINDGRVNTGVSAGLSAFDFDLAIEGEAQALDGDGNPTGGIEVKEERVDVVAPVPAFGMFIDYAIRPRLVFRASAEFFDLSVGDLEGQVVDTRASLTYFLSDHFGLGVGINTTDITYVDTGEPLRIDYRYSGVLGFLTFAF
jgi:hypothetical protein